MELAKSIIIREKTKAAIEIMRSNNELYHNGCYGGGGLGGTMGTRAFRGVWGGWLRHYKVDEPGGSRLYSTREKVTFAGTETPLGFINERSIYHGVHIILISPELIRVFHPFSKHMKLTM